MFRMCFSLNLYVFTVFCGKFLMNVNEWKSNLVIKKSSFDAWPFWILNNKENGLNRCIKEFIILLNHVRVPQKYSEVQEEGQDGSVEERINQRDIKPDKYFFLSKKNKKINLNRIKVLSIQIISSEYLWKSPLNSWFCLGYWRNYKEENWVREMRKQWKKNIEFTSRKNF